MDVIVGKFHLAADAVIKDFKFYTNPWNLLYKRGSFEGTPQDELWNDIDQGKRLQQKSAFSILMLTNSK